MFRTEIESSSVPFNINYDQKLLTLGSCFSDSIGQRFSQSKFDTLINPFGTIFNPLSIFELLELSLIRSEIIEEATLKRDGYYLNYKFHSSFRAKTKKTLHNRIENTLNQVKSRIEETDVVFITLGTAWIYQEEKSDMIVANCHKVPQKNFRKRLITLEEIITHFFDLKEQLKQLNPRLKFIFTVSPVRHTRDSLKLNSVSKSILRSACHFIEEMDEDVTYLPAYEIMMDDLRDYRFYEKDLIHPNEQAIDYIWNYVKETIIDPKSLKTLERWEGLKQNLEHIPFNPKSGGHQKFLQKTLDGLNQLNGSLPLDKEIDRLKKQIH